MRLLATIAAAALLAFAAPASANVITFETAPIGPGFTGPVTEDGFTYSTGFGGLYVDTLGNPGQNIEGTVVEGGGVLVIERADGGMFTFQSIDFAAYDASGSGTQDLILGGMVDGAFLVFDTFNLSNTAVFLPNFDNWTTEYATNLAGLQMDSLFVILGAGNDPTTFASAIDNVVLSPVPEPLSLALMGAGLVGVWRMRRRT